MEVFKESILIFIAPPFYAIVIGAEIILSQVSDRVLYTKRGVLENLLFTSLTMVVDILMRGMELVVLDFSYQHRLMEILL